MKTFNIVLEIEVDAETQLKAAKTVQNWLQEHNNNWCFYVQEDGKKEIVSVDLDEDDEDAVMEIGKYIPTIKN